MLLRSRQGRRERGPPGSENFLALRAAPPQPPGPPLASCGRSQPLPLSHPRGAKKGLNFLISGGTCTGQGGRPWARAPHSQEYLELLICHIFVHSHSKPERIQ